MTEDPLPLRVTNPVEITQAVRDAISKGKRVVGIKTRKDAFDPRESLVEIETAEAHEKHGLGGMEIPNQTKPHRIFDSMQLEDGPIDGLNRV